MKLDGNLIIAGEARDPETKRTRAVSPLDGSALPTGFASARESDVDDACTAGADAWPAYRRLEPAARAGFLRAIATQIEALGDELITRCRLETGLPEGRLTGERARTCNQLRLFADLIEEGS
ncbi:MAG: aldehyde dehydrogenase family protein, partial [Spirochaetota bacterium]